MTENEIENLLLDTKTNHCLTKFSKKDLADIMRYKHSNMAFELPQWVYYHCSLMLME